MYRSLDFKQPGLGRFRDDSLFDCRHDILRNLAIISQITFELSNARFPPCHGLKAHGAVCNPLDCIVLQDVILRQTRDQLFNEVAAHVLLLTSALCVTLLALVVIMHGSVLPGARYTDHVGAAIAAEQLPCKQIFSVCRPPPGGLFLICELFLHGCENLLFQNRRYSVLNHNARVTIDADVIVILQHDMEAVLIPLSAELRVDTALVERAGNLSNRHVFQNTVEYLTDNGCFIRRDGIFALLAFDVAEREHTVHLAFVGVVHHATLDVLAHVLGIELIHVHHCPQRKAACGGVAKFLFGVQRLDSEQIKPGLILQSVQHIAGNTVALVGNDDLKLPLLCVPHHALEIRAPIGAARHGLIRIDSDDSDSVLCGEVAAFGDLLFDAFFFLVVGGIAGIDHADLFSRLVFIFLR